MSRPDPPPGFRASPAQFPGCVIQSDSTSRFFAKSYPGFLKGARGRAQIIGLCRNLWETIKRKRDTRYANSEHLERNCCTTHDACLWTPTAPIFCGFASRCYSRPCFLGKYGPRRGCGDLRFHRRMFAFETRPLIRDEIDLTPGRDASRATRPTVAKGTVWVHSAV